MSDKFKQGPQIYENYIEQAPVLSSSHTQHLKNTFFGDNSQKTRHKILYNLVLEHIEQYFENAEIPDYQEHNKKILSQLIVKSKKLQKFYIEFEERLANIMKQEILYNKEQIKTILEFPYAKSPARNAKSLEPKPEIFNYKKIKLQQKNRRMGIEKAKQEFLAKSKKKEEVKDKEATIDPDDKYVEPVLSDFQILVKIQAEQLDNMVKSMDSNNLELRHEIRDYSREIERLERKKTTAIPGVRIKRVLKMMERDFVPDTEFNINKYAQHLWESLGKFENELRFEEKGAKLEYQHKAQIFYNQMEHFKEKTQFRIKALESALTDTKLIYKRKLEQQTMILNDFQSRIMNRVKPEKEVDKIVEMCENHLVLKNTREARTIIQSLTGIIRSKDYQNQELESGIDQMQNYNALIESKVSNFNAQLLKSNNLRKWYQNLVFKIIRDFNIFEGEKKEQFEMLNEEENEFQIQERIMIKLNDLGIKKGVQEMHNRYFGVLEGIERVKKQLEEVELIPRNPIQEKDLLRLDNKVKKAPVRAMTSVALINVKKGKQMLKRPVIDEVSSSSISEDSNPDSKKHKIEMGKTVEEMKQQMVLLKMQKKLQDTIRDAKMGVILPAAMMVEKPKKTKHKKASQVTKNSTITIAQDQKRANKEEKTPKQDLQKLVLSHNSNNQKLSPSSKQDKTSPKSNKDLSLLTDSRQPKKSSKNPMLNLLQKKISVQYENMLQKKIQELKNQETPNTVSPGSKSVVRANPKVNFEVAIDDLESSKSFQSISSSQYSDTPLFLEKYQNIVPSDLKFKAAQIEILGNLVEQNIPITFDQKMDLFRSDLLEFVKAFNQIIEKQENSDIITEILIPIKTPDGRMLGFNIREEMVPVILQEEDPKKVIERMKEIIKTCLKANNLLKDQEKEVKMQNMVCDQEVQVTYQDIKAAFNGSSNQVVTPELWLLNHIKELAIDIQSRMKPDKRNYYSYLWESFSLSELLSIKLDGVFKGEEINNLELKEYLIEMQKVIKETVEEKRVVRVDKMFESRQPRSIITSMQASSPGVRPIEVKSPIYRESNESQTMNREWPMFREESNNGQRESFMFRESYGQRESFMDISGSKKVPLKAEKAFEMSIKGTFRKQPFQSVPPGTSSISYRDIQIQNTISRSGAVSELEQFEEFELIPRPYVTSVQNSYKNTFDDAIYEQLEKTLELFDKFVDQYGIKEASIGDFYQNDLNLKLQQIQQKIRKKMLRQLQENNLKRSLQTADNENSKRQLTIDHNNRCQTDLFSHRTGRSSLNFPCGFMTTQTKRGNNKLISESFGDIISQIKRNKSKNNSDQIKNNLLNIGKLKLQKPRKSRNEIRNSYTTNLPSVRGPTKDFIPNQIVKKAHLKQQDFLQKLKNQTDYIKTEHSPEIESLDLINPLSNSRLRYY